MSCIRSHLCSIQISMLFWCFLPTILCAVGKRAGGSEFKTHYYKGVVCPSCMHSTWNATFLVRRDAECVILKVKWNKCNMEVLKYSELDSVCQKCQEVLVHPLPFPGRKRCHSLCTQKWRELKNCSWLADDICQMPEASVIDDNAFRFKYIFANICTISTLDVLQFTYAFCRLLNAAVWQWWK